jgi:MOSC domain-containing protein YiiM
VRTFEELEALYRSRPAVGPTGSVKLIVLRLGGGRHETPAQVRVDVEGGLEGDRWGSSRPRHRDAQVTLMSSEVASLIGGGAVAEHEAGDNFLIDVDLSVGALPVLARVRLGPVVVEVTDRPHLGCKKFEARYGPEALRWINHPAHLDRRLRGVNCRVLEGGEVRLGDLVVCAPSLPGDSDTKGR